MIYTCTLNPAIDYKIKMDYLELEELNRFDQGDFLVGGKGINVSIGLKKLGIGSIATGFLGGITGHYIKDVIDQKLNVKSHFIMIDALTRVNVKILIHDKETEINHNGVEVKDSEAQALLDYIDTLKPKDILICGGSSAKGQPDLYKKIAKHCSDHQVEIVMDTPSKYMAEYLKFKPLLMKPNLLELETYVLKKLERLEDIVDAGRALVKAGAKHVIVSLGKDGSLLINKYHVFKANPLKGEVKNTVGAGDSMVAGFIAAYEKNQSLVDCYKSAVAAASATTFGNEIVDLKVYNDILSQVEIEEINI